DDAASAYRDAREIYERLGADYPSVPSYRYKVAEALTGQATVTGMLRRNDEAVVLFTAALDAFGRLAAERPANPGFRVALANCHFNFGYLRWLGGAADQAEEQYRMAARVYE